MNQGCHDSVPLWYAIVCAERVIILWIMLGHIGWKIIDLEATAFTAHEIRKLFACAEHHLANSVLLMGPLGVTDAAPEFTG